jgi:hypothetical protein
VISFVFKFPKGSYFTLFQFRKKNEIVEFKRSRSTSFRNKNRKMRWARVSTLKVEIWKMAVLRPNQASSSRDPNSAKAGYGGTHLQKEI